MQGNIYFSNAARRFYRAGHACEITFNVNAAYLRALSACVRFSLYFPFFFSQIFYWLPLIIYFRLVRLGAPDLELTNASSNFKTRNSTNYSKRKERGDARKINSGKDQASFSRGTILRTILRGIKFYDNGLLRRESQSVSPARCGCVRLCPIRYDNANAHIG